MALALSVLLTGCHSRERASGATASPATEGAGGGAKFVDIAARAGIRFKHTSGASGRLYFPETVGSGCAVLDYDGDGRPDLYLVNSSRLPGFTGRGPFYPALYRNRGDGTFEDTTAKAGLAVDCYGIAAAVGDYDNDGDPDLYVAAMGPNHLFRNNGDGTFTDVTAQARVGEPAFSTAAAWLDYDRDGDLDLVVGNYCVWTPKANKICPDALDRKFMCRPNYYPGVRPRLYRNDGRSRFTDVSGPSGIANELGKTLGILVWDENADGWPDLLLANDGERNLLYRNQGNGRFVERGLEAGVALGASGMARAGMGIDTGDWENSGTEGIVIGNFAREGLALYRPDAPGHYVDVAAERGILEPSLTTVTFATVFVDADLDGHQDLIAANGHVEPNTEQAGDGFTFAQRMLLFRNDGAGRFTDVSSQSGAGVQSPIVGRGIAVGDIDGDGDPDLLISTNNGRPLLLRNEVLAPLAARRSPLAARSEDGPVLTASREPRAASATEGSYPHWLAIRPVGTKSNRDGIGTRVVVTARGLRQQRWVRSGSSYASSSELVARFGLGSAGQTESVTLNWPSGATQTLTNVKADQVLEVREETSGAAVAR